MSERVGGAGWPDRRFYRESSGINEARKAEAEQNPRDVLADDLKGETRGSLKVQALADWTTLEGVEAKLLSLGKQEIPDTIALLQATTEKAAIKETIRRKKFGEDAKEYNEAFGFGEIYGTYLTNERALQGGNNDLKIRENAAKWLLNDLEELNAQLPKKSVTPAKP